VSSFLTAHQHKKGYFVPSSKSCSSSLFACRLRSAYFFAAKQQRSWCKWSPVLSWWVHGRYWWKWDDYARSVVKWHARSKSRQSEADVSKQIKSGGIAHQRSVCWILHYTSWGDRVAVPSRCGCWSQTVMITLTKIVLIVIKPWILTHRQLVKRYQCN